YDDYYDDYGEQERRERVKRFVILGVVILLLLLSIFFIARKLLKKGDDPVETTEETTNESVAIEESEDEQENQVVVQPIETTTETTQYQPNEQDLFDLTFMTTEGETPRAFIASIYGEAEEIHYQFLKRYNPSIPEMDTVMAAGIALKVPLAESGPFKLLDSWSSDPIVWPAYQQEISEARQNNPQDEQPVQPETTDFNQDDSQADDSSDNNTNP
ncbi:MAG: hypothetical protein Q4P65_04610, partial [Eubacteriales bacterium]|nr:hypothetical protein [Eubacteriales bacterium]